MQSAVSAVSVVAGAASASELVVKIHGPNGHIRRLRISTDVRFEEVLRIAVATADGRPLQRLEWTVGLDHAAYPRRRMVLGRKELATALSTAAFAVPRVLRLYVGAGAATSGCCGGGGGGGAAATGSACCPPPPPSKRQLVSASALDKCTEAVSRLSQYLTSFGSAPETSCCAGSSCCSAPAVPAPSPPAATPFTYSGESLRAVALPFGGIGGGSVALAGDGGLRQWQINNNVNHLGAVPGCFFGIRVVGGSGTTPYAAVLQSKALYDSTGFVPAPMITDHIVPQCSIDLLSALPSVAQVSIAAQFPNATVSYSDPALPVNVSMEVLSPFIPLDSTSSSLPVVFFNFTVSNPSGKPATVSLLQVQQNIAGWDGQSDITSELSNPGYGGNANSYFKVASLVAIDMSNPSLTARDAGNGHVAIAAVNAGSGTQVAAQVQAASVAEVWSNFNSSQGLSGQGPTAASPAGRSYLGALSQTVTIAAGGTATLSFVLAWHFPNRYVNWDQSGFGISDPHNNFWVGNQYAVTWPAITDVLYHVSTNWEYLTTTTRQFQQAVYTSNLPWQVLDSAAPRAVVLRTPTCMWMADGNFYAFEGCSTTAGCCPLNCTHVWNYEMALAALFPDLERTMRAIDLQQQIAPNAIIPSRTTVPLELRRQWSFWPSYTQIDPASTAICVDGEIGTVLKLYREVLAGAPTAWFNEQWPQAQQVMTRWMTVLDTKGDGLIRGPQPNTYDCSLYGVNTFVGTLYLAALLAAEQMAVLQGDTSAAATYHARFVTGSANLNTACWTNGKWFTQVVDPDHQVFLLTDGCFVDQLANIATAVTNVFTANHRTSFNTADQSPRVFFDSRDAGCYIGTWPNGDTPSWPLLYTNEGCWTGLAYAMAGLAMQEGCTSVWTTMLSDIRARQDGTRRSPWNEIECGDHYSRQMSGWQLLAIASGQLWNAPAQTLSFAPRINAAEFLGFFIVSGGWGQYKQVGDATLGNGSVSVMVQFGSVQLLKLNLAAAATSVVATVGSKPVACTATQSSGQLTVTFASLLTVVAGTELTLALSS